jgi:hypothetical protein
VNTDALINLLKVDKGMLITESGMQYKVLALDSNSMYMTLPVIRKIRDLVKAGAIVAGPKPINTPSMSDDENEFQKIATELWSTSDGIHEIGKGRVISGQSLQEVMETLGIVPDFEYEKSDEDTKLLFVHRKKDNIDFYWVNSRNDKMETVNATFRVKGMEAEIWHPETGLIEPASYSIADGRTTVTMRLMPDDAVFVVFRNKTTKKSREIAAPRQNHLTTVEGPWSISFQPNRGAPEMVNTDTLFNFSLSSDAGIKYFSGTATYKADVNIPEDWFSEKGPLWMDLGDVKNLVEVVINDSTLGILWKAPFRLKINDALKPGLNKMEFRVTNLWVNRLIGDQQPGIDEKITYTTMPFYQSNSPLMPSGLLGPVMICRME